MINFFRKIRKKLADDNQFLKYSRYAIGEIVLVVVGILIALYINNWNEERKNKEMTLVLFEEIQTDLLNTILDFQGAIDQYSDQHYMIFNILRDSVTENNIGDYPFPSPIFQAPVFDIDKNGFNKLNNSVSSIPFEYQDIFGNLIEVYQGLDYVREKQKQLEEKMRDNHDHIATTKDWYSRDWRSNTAIEYFVDDPIYRNLVAQFNTYLDDFNLFFNIDNMIKMYLFISEFTHINEMPNQFQHHLDQDIKEFAGIYHWKDSIKELEFGERVISTNWNSLNYHPDSPPFYEYAKDSFVMYFNNTLCFKRDSLGQIIGAKRLWQGQILELEKEN